MGINTRNIKLAAFAFGALTGGSPADCLHGHATVCQPGSFGLPESVMIPAMVVLGGPYPRRDTWCRVARGHARVIRATSLTRTCNKVFGTVLIAPEVLRNLIFSPHDFDHAVQTGPDCGRHRKEMMGQHAVHRRGVTKKFGGVTALDNVSMAPPAVQFWPGGPNGARQDRFQHTDWPLSGRSGAIHVRRQAAEREGATQGT